MDRSCSVYRTVDFLGKRWTILVLLELYKGGARKKRYSELKRRLSGITPKMLCSRLRELEKLKVVRRTVDPKAFPVRTEYALTESGRDFVSIIRGVKSWALKWNVKSGHCTKTDCKDCKF
jgi:DNA-binding HxlR family transcriptional regulator